MASQNMLNRNSTLVNEKEKKMLFSHSEGESLK
jgi:hypothetical protein